jgi:hypothetical protein
MMRQFQGELSGGSGVAQHVNNNKLHAAVGDWHGKRGALQQLHEIELEPRPSQDGEQSAI